MSNADIKDVEHDRQRPDVRIASKPGRKSVFAEGNLPRSLHEALGAIGFYRKDLPRELLWTRLPNAESYSWPDRLLAILLRVIDAFGSEEACFTALGYNRKTFVRYLKGQSHPSPEALYAASRVSDIPYDWFTFGTADTTLLIIRRTQMPFREADPIMSSIFSPDAWRTVPIDVALAEIRTIRDRYVSGMSDRLVHSLTDGNRLSTWTIGEMLPETKIPELKQIAKGDFTLTEEARPGFPPSGLTRKANVDEKSSVRIAFYDVRASAGAGAAPLEEMPRETIEMERRLAEMLGITASEIIALPVQGDSAQPGLCEGDTIFVDRASQELRDGGLYVIGVDSDVVVKRVHRQMDRSVILRSDNPAYEPQHVSAADVEHLRVIGRVRWAVRGM